MAVLLPYITTRSKYWLKIKHDGQFAGLGKPLVKSGTADGRPLTRSPCDVT